MESAGSKVHGNSAVIIRSNTPLDGSLQQRLAIQNSKVYLGPDETGGQRDREGISVVLSTRLQDEVRITLQNSEGWLAVELPDYEKRATE
jgi:hypothetical protein